MLDSSKMESLSGRPGSDCLLVLGYQGTLRPQRSQNFPPVMEALLEPWLEQAWQRLIKHIPQEHSIFQGEPVPLDSLFRLLKNRLIGIVTQALGDVGSASGAASAGEIFREFPLLPPLMRHAISEWVAASATFLGRLHRDQIWLASSLQIGKLPPIESVCGTASDMHAGGHSALRVCFRGGGCLYYKPRPLTGEWLWHELLKAIARTEPQLLLASSHVFTREANSIYGWAGSVILGENWLFHSADPTPPAADYWHAAGAMICLAQHVRMTDLHLANIIATPSGPGRHGRRMFGEPDLIVRSLSEFLARREARLLRR